MRSFIATFFIAGALAQSIDDYLSCAESALDNIKLSQFKDCTNKSSVDCLCSNTDALTALGKAAASACGDAGIDTSDLASTLCSGTSSSDSDQDAVPARHASNPMEPVINSPMELNHHKRAYAPAAPASAEPRVVYVTETRTECSCKSTPAPAYDPMHISQIPVQVPASSSMGAMAAASSPAYSHGVRVGGTSSVIFGSQMSAATPLPSGASPNQFNTFKGSAPKTNAVQGGIAAAAVAAIMSLMVAL